jgi:hypothetical protein
MALKTATAASLAVSGPRLHHPRKLFPVSSAGSKACLGEGGATAAHRERRVGQRNQYLNERITIVTFDQ